jgi:hypothetical protein
LLSRPSFSHGVALRVVKQYGGANEFCNRDADCYYNVDHLRSLYAESAIQGVKSLDFDEGFLTRSPASSIEGPDLSRTLTGIYLANDIAYAGWRIVCLLLFAVGFALVAAPTLFTFGPVVWVTIQ